MRLAGWVPDYPDPDNYLRVCARNWTAWRNEAYDRVVEHAVRVMDHRERMRLYAQAQRIIVEDVPLLSLTYRSVAVLLKPWVKKYPVSSTGMIYWSDVIIEPH
jgi:ABC-type oligopeptide transport system substrate-binding subunit